MLTISSSRTTTDGHTTAAATLVGFLVAVGVGARHGGLVVAWLGLFAAYIGFRADLAFLGLSSHPLDGQFAFLFDPVGLAVFGVATLIIGTVGFAVGYLGRSSLYFRIHTGGYLANQQQARPPSLLMALYHSLPCQPSTLDDSCPPCSVRQVP
jgi:hypothetical protein